MVEWFCRFPIKKEKMTLGGFLFIKDGVKFDYCFQQAIISLCEFCDKVVVVDAGSVDGTKEILETMAFNIDKLSLYCYPIELWDSLHGKTKLAYFQNLACEHLETDYQFLLQGDEIVSESSYSEIRKAMETGQEGFLVSRINLWGSPYTELNVPLNRMPCSPQVIRLTKKGYKTYDDGENICAPASPDFVKELKIWHMGFVRKKEVMKEKIIHMQETVFEMGHDQKLDGMDVFDWRGWFAEGDLKPISEPLPRIIQGWAMTRE